MVNTLWHSIQSNNTVVWVVLPLCYRAILALPPSLSLRKTGVCFVVPFVKVWALTETWLPRQSWIPWLVPPLLMRFQVPTVPHMRRRCQRRNLYLLHCVPASVSLFQEKKESQTVITKINESNCNEITGFNMTNYNIYYFWCSVI